jgi:hypothetical protein
MMTTTGQFIVLLAVTRNPGGLNSVEGGAEMAKECFVKFGAGQYSVSTKTGTHLSKEFPTREAVKAWLVENRVLPAVAEGYLLVSV